ncbi:MAG: lipid-A-disaccharide synthase N-terminal domain-containing protein [Flavobacteriales bacterium]|nr:lipid-A-disaccharide synthase N-terminal domain-containing protein [Flavobacteriales bacterium]
MTFLEIFSSEAFILTIGFSAQILFSGRMLSQWILSERAKKIIVPKIFWIFSLLGSFLLFVYGWLREDFAIMFGQVLTYFIYIRNMQLQGTWRIIPMVFRIFLFLFPILIIVYSYNNGRNDLNLLLKNEDVPLYLLLWGSIGQVIFTCRFIYQWIYSEYQKKSELPMGFWFLSFTGSILIISYAIIRKDPVLIVGQLFGLVVYTRNIYIGIINRKG